MSDRECEKGYVDFHSHMLFKVDDGSASVEQSLEMIARSYESGVRHIVLSPHFYATNNDPEKFFERRERRKNELLRHLPERSPKLYFGAELHYYEGITHMENLERFRIGDSKCLLLEMPFEKWTDRILSDVVSISQRKNFRVILAHFERYSKCVSFEDMVALKREGVRIQANAEYFLNFFSKKKALHLVEDGFIDVIGSDSHDMKRRPPNVGDAMSLISQRCGDHVAERISGLSEALLKW